MDIALVSGSLWVRKLFMTCMNLKIVSAESSRRGGADNYEEELTTLQLIYK